MGEASLSPLPSPTPATKPSKVSRLPAATSLPQALGDRDDVISQRLKSAPTPACVRRETSDEKAASGSVMLASSGMEVRPDGFGASVELIAGAAGLPAHAGSLMVRGRGQSAFGSAAADASAQHATCCRASAPPSSRAGSATSRRAEALTAAEVKFEEIIRV